MARQISKDKKQVSVVLTLDQLKRLDGRAAELGTSRAALISKAVDALLDGSPAEDASAAKLEAVLAKLDGLASGQAAIASAQDALKSEQLAQATALADAIRNQPIAVQQLPPAEPPAKKGFIGRIFG